MRRLKRGLCLLLALGLFIFTPASDYIGTRYNVYAMSGALSAVEYVWSVLMGAAGVDVAQKNLSSVINDIGDWVQVDTRYINAYKGLGKFAFDSTVKLGQQTIDMIRDYFKTKNGYGTSAGIDQIKIGVNNSFENSYSAKIGINLNALNPPINEDDYSFSFDSSSSGVMRHGDFFLILKDTRVGGVVAMNRLEFYALDENGAMVSPFSKMAYEDETGKYYTYYRNSSFYSAMISGIEFNAETTADIPFPIYSNYDGLRSYLRYGTLGETINEYTGAYTWVEVHSDVDTQQREITSDVEIKIPEDSFTAEKLIESLQSAITAADRAQVLAPTMEVVYGEKVTDDEQTDTYPWIPDITRPLGVITDVIKGVAKGVEGIKDRILDIPGALSNILSGVKALPVSITDSIANSLAKEEDAEMNNWQIQADITRKFPFSIPFDLFACIGVFKETSTAPRWEIPFVISSLNIHETIVLDLSSDDWLSMVMLVRISTLIGYCIFLIVITRNLIKG